MTTAKYNKITPEKAAEMMKGDIFLLDARGPGEFKEKHIANAINIPHTEVGEKALLLIPNKDTIILVYCKSGGRSKMAAEALINLGYTNVYDFGGIDTDWKGPVITDKNVKYLNFISYN